MTKEMESEKEKEEEEGDRETPAIGITQYTCRMRKHWHTGIHCLVPSAGEIPEREREREVMKEKRISPSLISALCMYFFSIHTQPGIRTHSLSHTHALTQTQTDTLSLSPFFLIYNYRPQTRSLKTDLIATLLFSHCCLAAAAASTTASSPRSASAQRYVASRLDVPAARRVEQR